MNSSKLSQVGVLDLAKRFRSKKEMHDFLESDCRAFIPSLQSTTIFFMKAIFQGTKEVSDHSFECRWSKVKFPSCTKPFELFQ
jgi:hypothetical protein